jgi:tRNA threonylcarbamoyl adenosine modification protein (Sua5/YciO/YrdC/YwlC family)
MILKAQPSLTWDLGETKGTVALRVPDHKIALALLEETGPLAVSSANLTKQPAATSVPAAQEMLGDAVAAYLDSGVTPGNTASTILDLTEVVDRASIDGTLVPSGKIRVVRVGAISTEEIRKVTGDIEVVEA